MRNHKKIYILMIIATVLWSGAFIAGKYNAPYISPFTLTFLRFIVATVIIKGIIVVTKVDYKLTKAHLPIFIATGIVGMFGYHVFFFGSLKYTTVTNSSIIAAANPMITTIIMALFLKNFVTRKQLIGIIISFLGVILTITGMDISVLTNITFNKGDLLMLTATTLWAIYSVISKAKCKGIPPIITTYYSFLICTIFVIPFCIYEKPWEFLPDAPMTAWVSVLYMAVFPSVIGYLTQQHAIKELGPTRASIFVNLVPVFSMILAILLLGENFEVVKVITGGIIIFGVILCQTGGEGKSRE